MTVSAIQMPTCADEAKNLAVAGEMMDRAMEQHPDVVVLPEMFACPYETPCFPRYAQEAGGKTWQALSALARDHGVYLIAGSVPEREGEDVYNTSYVFDPRGEQIARHRKVHLFDINVAGGQAFKESDTLTAGRDTTVFDTPFGRMGLCICYDIRFPEIFRRMVDAGAQAVFVPAAFNMTTGPAHWELSFRMRALDNQIFCVGCAPARDVNGSYVSWAHSIMTDPWGGVIAQLQEKPGILTRTLDLERVAQVREQLPLLHHRRADLGECPVKEKA